MFSDEEMGDGLENHLVKVTSKPATLGNMNPHKDKEQEKVLKGKERGDERRGWEGMGLTPREEQNNKSKTSQKKNQQSGDRKEYMKRSAESTFQTGEMSE